MADVVKRRRWKTTTSIILLFVSTLFLFMANGNWFKVNQSEVVFWCHEGYHNGCEKHMQVQKLDPKLGFYFLSINVFLYISVFCLFYTWSNGFATKIPRVCRFCCLHGVFLMVSSIGILSWIEFNTISLCCAWLAIVFAIGGVLENQQQVPEPPPDREEEVREPLPGPDRTRIIANEVLQRRLPLTSILHGSPEVALNDVAFKSLIIEEILLMGNLPDLEQRERIVERFDSLHAVHIMSQMVQRRV